MTINHRICWVITLSSSCLINVTCELFNVSCKLNSFLATRLNLRQKKHVRYKAESHKTLLHHVTCTLSGNRETQEIKKLFLCRPRRWETSYFNFPSPECDTHRMRCWCDTPPFDGRYSSAGSDFAGQGDNLIKSLPLWSVLTAERRWSDATDTCQPTTMSVTTPQVTGRS